MIMREDARRENTSEGALRTVHNITQGGADIPLAAHPWSNLGLKAPPHSRLPSKPRAPPTTTGNGSIPKPPMHLLLSPQWGDPPSLPTSR